MKKLLTITLTLVEGPTSWCGKPHDFPSFSQADAQLRQWRTHLYVGESKDPGGYYKCDFRIVWDGEAYTGRYDIEFGDRCDLAGHVRDYLTFASGRRRPDHITVEQYTMILARAPDLKVAAAAILDGCQLGD
jgi:hypothetical protein